MNPYYQDDFVTIYHADCREVLPTLEKVDLVLTDPPYGIGVQTDYAGSGRGKPSARSTHVGRKRLASANSYPPVIGDHEPFDPSHILAMGVPCVLWGANHYAHRLPPSGAWFVWDRVSGGSATADAELAWTNLAGTVRRFEYRWNGACRAGEKETHGLHPTQKPVALMSWVIQRTTEPGQTILDPYMGSGPIEVAAKDLGRKAIGIEIEERYCEIAARRCAQEVIGL